MPACGATVRSRQHRWTPPGQPEIIGRVRPAVRRSSGRRVVPSAMTFAAAARPTYQTLLATMSPGKGCLMEITNLGKADGLPPVDWAAVAEKLDARSAPAPDAHNSRTTWLSTLNEDGS